MAMASWSNPNPSGDTAAKLAPEQLHFADIGNVVAAIMKMRESQAAQKQKEQEDLFKGIGSAAGSVSSGYEKYSDEQGKSAMADYMNSYHQGLTDPSSMEQAQVDMDARLKDMTPSQRAKVMQWQIEQDSKHKSDFVVGPDGQPYYRTSRGVAPVGGAAKPETAYQLDQLKNKALNNADGEIKAAQKEADDASKIIDKSPNMRRGPAAAEGGADTVTYVPPEGASDDELAKGQATMDRYQAAIAKRQAAEAKKLEIAGKPRESFGGTTAGGGGAGGTTGSRPGAQAARLEGKRAIQGGKDPALVAKRFEDTFGEPF